jgi:hypothetical protein
MHHSVHDGFLCWIFYSHTQLDLMSPASHHVINAKLIIHGKYILLSYKDV